MRLCHRNRHKHIIYCVMAVPVMLGWKELGLVLSEEETHHETNGLCIAQIFCNGHVLPLLVHSTFVVNNHSNHTHQIFTKELEFLMHITNARTVEVVACYQ